MRRNTCVVLPGLIVKSSRNPWALFPDPTDEKQSFTLVSLRIWMIKSFSSLVNPVRPISRAISQLRTWFFFVCVQVHHLSWEISHISYHHGTKQSHFGSNNVFHGCLAGLGSWDRSRLMLLQKSIAFINAARSVSCCLRHTAGPRWLRTPVHHGHQGTSVLR